MWKSEVVMDEEERRRRNLEEALEVKSLRRIISAYLNYPDAAEDDVRRYERSFRMLRPAHKSLLSHLPSKYQSLRRCIQINTHFILHMLQAFEPPLDMSLDVNDCDDQHPGCSSDQHHHHQNESLSSIHHRSAEESMVKSTNSQEEQLPGLEREPESGETGFSALSASSQEAQELQHGAPNSNGNAAPSSFDWLDPSLQLSVPLVDVDKMDQVCCISLPKKTNRAINLTKVRCIIRNIVRDWAAEGQVERDQCYQPILKELERLFPSRSKESPPSCLVPGAGLGRLALEISRLGFACQGNEFSYYMMICSNFILNHTQSVGEWNIYPWIHSNCNSLSDEDQLRAVSIPDILPASAGITEGFSMCGGDFVEVYSDPSQAGTWDAVVTCFFIDTAHNIVEYIDIIWKILKDGGVWINLGPLLYHFADSYGHNDMSIELSLEDVKKGAFHYGFCLEKESTIVTTYTTNIRSMMQNRYFAAFWTMTKTTRKRTEDHDAE